MLPRRPHLYAAVDGCNGLVAISQEAPLGVAWQRHLPLPQPAIRRHSHHQQALTTQDGRTAAAAAAAAVWCAWAAWNCMQWQQQ
jgi:hypothetical protein